MRSRLPTLLLCTLLLAAWACPAAAQSGYALTFTSSNNSRVLVPLATPEGPFTLEAWVRFEGDPEVYGIYPIMEFGDDLPFFGVVGDVLQLRSKTSSVVMADSLPRSQWQHVAYSYDGTNSTLYVNGEAVTSAEADPPGGGADLGIGYRLGDTGWPGYIDEVIIWDRARTASEIAADMAGLSATDVEDPALLACFPFDEVRGR